MRSMVFEDTKYSIVTGQRGGKCYAETVQIALTLKRGNYTPQNPLMIYMLALSEERKVIAQQRVSSIEELLNLKHPEFQGCFKFEVKVVPKKSDKPETTMWEHII